MSLILVFHNDGTGHDTVGNYNVRVMIGDGTVEHTRDIAGGRVLNHDRLSGWEPLVRHFLDDRETMTVVETLDTALKNVKARRKKKQGGG